MKMTIINSKRIYRNYASQQPNFPKMKAANSNLLDTYTAYSIYQYQWETLITSIFFFFPPFKNSVVAITEQVILPLEATAS